MIENLNKENFWNELYAKYPEKVQIFCDWIDKYKAENDWDRLFAKKDVPQSTRGEINEMWLAPENPTKDELKEIQEKEWEIIEKTKSVKFHDLPLAMQMGIFWQFRLEYEKMHEDFIYLEAIDEIREFFEPVTP